MIYNARFQRIVKSSTQPPGTSSLLSGRASFSMGRNAPSGQALFWLSFLRYSMTLT
jgi:hypothetical protein